MAEKMNIERQTEKGQTYCFCQIEQGGAKQRTFTDSLTASFRGNFKGGRRGVKAFSRIVFHS
jgi:hypothetical protein